MYSLVNSLSVLTAKHVLPPSIQELALSYEDPKLFWLLHLVFRRFCPGSLRVVQLGITCQNPSSTVCSIALNVLLRTFLDYGLYLVI